MRSVTSFMLFAACALALCLSGPSRFTSASTASWDEASPRAPFSLELPELGGAQITAAEAHIPTAHLSTLRLKVRKPFADAINYGKIYTTINGEAANTIQEIRAGRDGYLITCDLESKPRFRLRPGKNVIEISAIDRTNRSYYASYVLLAGGPTLEDASAPVAGAATLESVAVDKGDDREPPLIHLVEPNGPVRSLKANDTVRVRGTVTDDSGALDSLKINGQAISLSPVESARRPLAFERAIKTGTSASIVIEARDRAGNLSRLTIPLQRGVAVVSAKFTGRKFAVIIGVSKYKFHDGGLKDLDYADVDSRAVRDFLEQREGGGFAPSDVLYLENEGATIESVRAALARFLPRAGPNDLIFLFIAGHGAPDPYAPQNLYFILHDTKVADMPRTALPMSELHDFLDHSVRAERVVVFVDACHSAGLSGAQLVTSRGLEHTENNVFNLYAAKLFNETGRAVLTSSDVNEISQESATWGNGHGIFTWALLEGLRGEADINNDKLITAGELFDFVTNRVSIETNFQQNPKALAGLNRDLALAVATK